MPGTANYSLLILFEDEIRTAATLLTKAQRIYEADPESHDARRAVLDAICACAVALQGADDNRAVLMLTNKPHLTRQQSSDFGTSE